jgi:hypothetical protein
MNHRVLDVERRIEVKKYRMLRRGPKCLSAQNVNCMHERVSVVLFLRRVVFWPFVVSQVVKFRLLFFRGKLMNDREKGVRCIVIVGGVNHLLQPFQDAFQL